LSTRLTVAGETPTVVAILLPGMRWRRRLSMRTITFGGVGLRSRLGPCEGKRLRLHWRRPAFAH
jgi:hypothetical protein